MPRPKLDVAFPVLFPSRSFPIDDSLRQVRGDIHHNDICVRIMFLFLIRNKFLPFRESIVEGVTNSCEDGIFLTDSHCNFGDRFDGRFRGLSRRDSMSFRMCCSWLNIERDWEGKLSMWESGLRRWDCGCLCLCID